VKSLIGGSDWRYNRFEWFFAVKMKIQKAHGDYAGGETVSVENWDKSVEGLGLIDHACGSGFRHDGVSGAQPWVDRPCPGPPERALCRFAN